MNVQIVGAGPAGLYGAILLKKSHPRWNVRVVERNPPDATYGWGIVFSDRTLGSFRDADYPTYEAISDRLVAWDVVEVRLEGAATRCGGNVFCGMSRKLLLEILQRRCRALGVALEFRTEVMDLSTLDGNDVVIAADGANSAIRQSLADAFRPSIRWGKAKYAWFGSRRIFDAFTFIFRRSEHGLFQAHVYPHVGSVSTFIVECSEETWRRAGLDRASEAESLAYCQDMFAPDLGHHPLLANRSAWLSFPTIRNRTWHHGRIVLLGDAAHTAHFSIGSGTKLAMEDAIALANAFASRGEDAEAAFDDYALERRPIVEALQEAALESSEYFENTARYLGFDPLQFAFHLLTRNSRVSYDELRRRDAGFVDAVDRSYFRRASAGPSVRNLAFAPPPMFAPIRLREAILPSRVALAMPPTDSAHDGMPAEDTAARLEGCLADGVGVVFTELWAVSPEGRVTSGCPVLHRAEQAAALAHVADLVHRRSAAKLAVQLGHAGPRGSTRPRNLGVDRPLAAGGWALLAPSPIPYTPHAPLPRAMDERDMERVRDQFVRAAGLADQAGADLLQLHCAQGYLLSSFLSPLANLRDDCYGGSLENRMRFPLEVFDAVRRAWPEPKPLSVALSATDWRAGGFQVDDAVEFARRLRAAGCDLVLVLAGLTRADSVPRYRRYDSALFADRVRNEAGIPTALYAAAGTSDEINGLLAAGRADLCMITPRREQHAAEAVAA